MALGTAFGREACEAWVNRTVVEGFTDVSLIKGEARFVFTFAIDRIFIPR